MVQTPVQTPDEKYAYLQAGSNPVCASRGDILQDVQSPAKRGVLLCCRRV
jgi:hypothetical protein